MLIVLLLVGFVFGSPLPETEGQSSPSNDGALLDIVSETKSVPILQTVSFPSYGETQENNMEDSRSRLQTNPLDEVEDLVPVSITSPSMFSNGGKISSEIHLFPDNKRYSDNREGVGKEASRGVEDTGRNEPQFKTEKEAGFEPKEFHVTSEVRTVQFQVAKTSHHETFLPPVVFAQQPPEINLEPTEVEAPGTTPTTISMVTDAMPLTTHTVFPIPFLAANQSFQIFKIHNSKKGKSPLTDHNVDNVASDDISQQDDPRRLTLESYPTHGHTVGDSVIKNETSKFIRDSPVVYIKNFELSNSETGKSEVLTNSKEKTFEDATTKYFVKDSLNEQSEVVDPSFKEGENPESSGMLMDEMASGKLVAEALNTENESYVNKDNANGAAPSVITKNLTEAKLCNHNSVDAKCITENHSSRNQSQAPLLLEIKSNLDRNTSANVPDAMEIATEAGPDLVTVISESKDPRFKDVTATGESGPEKSSNIEIREANDESYFRSLGSGESRESRIYIENNKRSDEESNPTPAPIESTTQQNNEQVKMEVYTVSSEINYRNFNPDVNTSDIMEPEMPLASTHNLNESRRAEDSDGQVHLKDARPLEEPHISKVKVIYSDKISESLDLADVDERISEEQLSESGIESTAIPDPNSSPNREATVKSIKVNVSNPPSPGDSIPSTGRIIKTPEKENLHLLPGELDPDAEETFPLGIYPQKPSLSPPMQQERISVPISEAINKSMTPAGVAGIVMGVLLSVFVIAGAAGFYYYHRQTDIRPKVLSSDRSCANSDSGGYLDDQCRVAYVNSQGTPEDLVSLDNDSFLNSLESMTIQNLWTDSIRHTKL